MKKIKIFIFIVVCIFLFFGTQSVLTPKWNYPQTEDCQILIKSFENQRTNIDDVIFFGASHSGHGVSPLYLYEKNGIVSYNLSTSNQPLGVTYELLKYSLKTQHPKVVVIDCSKVLNYTNWDASWRYVLDSMPLSKEKIELATVYADEMEWSNSENCWWDSFCSAVIPLVKYHTRWDEISKSDFEINADVSWYVTNGYFINPIIKPSDYTHEFIDEMAQKSLGDRKKTVISNANGEIICSDNIEYLYKPEVSDKADEWIDKIKVLCDREGIHLLLVKVPTNRLAHDYDGAWTKIKYNNMKEYATEKGIDYIDLQYDVDLGLEWDKDTDDKGSHLNYCGAKKVSDFLGSYLVDKYNVGRNTILEMDEKLEKYNKLVQVAEIETETNTISYFSNLVANMDKYIICMAVNDGYLFGLPNDVVEALKKLKLQTEFEKYDYQYSYVAYVENGKVKYESLSNRSIEWDISKEENGIANIKLVSSGWFTKSFAKIEIDGVDYAINSRGLNVVVIDKETGLVIDKMVTDSYEDPYTCRHDSGIGLIQKYAHTLN